MTSTDTPVEKLNKIGLRWHPAGTAGYTGPLLRLARDLDAGLLQLARPWNPTDEQHPSTLPVAWLEKFGYLRSFPHQATFAVGLDTDRANIEAFVEGPVIGDDAVILTREAPITEVLTPAACYHLYVAHHGESPRAPLYLTTHNTCFRREQEYRPLRRQRSFRMREFVCIGTDSETATFLERARVLVDGFAAAIGLPVRWEQASDPFFRPNTDPRHLLQKIMPVKHEATYGDLAIASLNRHFDHFGTAASIIRDDTPAHSACVAFGLDRWLWAIINRHGVAPSGWPDLPTAAVQIRDRCEVTIR